MSRYYEVKVPISEVKPGDDLVSVPSIPIYLRRAEVVRSVDLVEDMGFFIKTEKSTYLVRKGRETRIRRLA